MSELIKTAVNVKDPFTLFAFLAALLLIAFRTKSVPESLFKLLGQKMTRERFYQLLHRAFLYAFLAFLVVCGIAVLGQVLGYMTTARAASLEELKTELASSHANDSAARQAMEAYQKGLAQAEDQKLSDAIASLQASVQAVPTAAAQETLALLYQKAGDTARASQLADEVVSAAHANGDAVRIARAERLRDSISSSPTPPAPRPKSCPSDAGLVGSKLDLPPGGPAFETATPLPPCAYKGLTDTVGEQWMYYKLSVPQGQSLKVVMRTRDVQAQSVDIRLHGPDGGVVNGYHVYGESAVTNPLEYKAEQPAVVFVSLKGALRGAAFDFSLH